MHKIIITSSKFDGSLEFEMDDTETVRIFKNNANLDEKQQQWFAENFPITLTRLNTMLKSFPSLKAELVEADLSFENFWKTYDHKVGHKKRGEKLWNKLSDAKKLQALASIPGYNNYLFQHPNIQRMYPDTYLYQKRFETDYKKLVK